MRRHGLGSTRAVLAAGVALGAGLALGCVSRGDPRLDRVRVTALERSPRAMDEARDWLGEPDEIEVHRSGITTWRYERRRRELAQPGPIRETACSTLGWIPIVRLPLTWLRACDVIEVRETLALSFAPDGGVSGLSLEQDEAPPQPHLDARWDWVLYPVVVPLGDPRPRAVPNSGDASRRDVPGTGFTNDAAVLELGDEEIARED